MKAGHTNNLKIFLWISAVYVLSFLCYLPTLLEQHGIVLPSGLFLLKYFFVCVPAMAAVCLFIFEHNLKKSFAQMFSGKITIRCVLTWAVFTVAGILISYCYSHLMRVEVFQNTYSSITSLLAACIYLFITAFVEEIAWRGFLLERVSARKGIYGILIAGTIWAIWHMPMWVIRNALGLEEIVCLCIWTLFVSVVLGATYYRCKNILLIAALHASFNLCYLAPIQYNIAALAIITGIGTLLIKNKHTE